MLDVHEHICIFIFVLFCEKKVRDKKAYSTECHDCLFLKRPWVEVVLCLSFVFVPIGNLSLSVVCYIKQSTIFL